MIVLIIGLVIFFGIHLVPVTGVKSSLIERMGEKKYQSIFSIISLIIFSLFFIFYKKRFPFLVFIQIF